jgi:hypothetical protein
VPASPGIEAAELIVRGIAERQVNQAAADVVNGQVGVPVAPAGSHDRDDPVVSQKRIAVDPVGLLPRRRLCRGARRFRDCKQFGRSPLQGGKKRQRNQA